jgi:uncharacterized protein YkwD
MKRVLGSMMSSIALLGATSVPFVQPSHRILADPPASVVAPAVSPSVIVVTPAKPKPKPKPAPHRVSRPAASRSRSVTTAYRASRPATVVTAESGAESHMTSMANGVRANAGCRSVSPYGGLPSYARNHSASMASSGTLYHSSEQQLYAACPSCQWVGEIVGAGPTLDSVQQSFVNSSSHYATMTNGNFRWIGTGVVFANGEYWVTEVYGG